ncbi:MAG: hypothetical protein ACRC5S_07980 [Cetobacterium sp.]
MQIVQMELRSRRGSFSFIIKGKAALIEKRVLFLDYTKSEISLDREINNNLFNEKIKRSFWKSFKESIIFEPNFNGIGIDFKKLFEKE